MNEARCYELLKQVMPDTILISIGHNTSLERFHRQVLELQSEARWTHRTVNLPA